jgi:hypothetical protein
LCTSNPQTKALMLWLERRTDKRLLMPSRECRLTPRTPEKTLSCIPL